MEERQVSRSQDGGGGGVNPQVQLVKQQKNELQNDLFPGFCPVNKDYEKARCQLTDEK